MENILWLNVAENRRLENYTGFLDCLKEWNLESLEIRAPLGRRIEDDYIQNAIDSSAAFILQSRDLIDVKVIRKIIKDKIKSGIPLLVFCSNPSLNDFLLDYDLAVTKYCLYQPSSPLGYDRLVELLPKEQPFCDVELLKGINSIVVQQPSSIWYGRESSPLLVGNKSVQVVDDMDLPVEWGARKLCCAAKWQGNENSAVWLFAGGFFHDPYTGPFSQHFPGIESNRTLAKNLISKILRSTRKTFTLPMFTSLIEKIEVKLHDLVMHLLKTKYGKNWWINGVHARIRKKCEDRYKEEKCVRPKESYLDIVDYKEIIKKNWQIFSSVFESMFNTKGKARSLRWIVSFNNTRKVVAHSIKYRSKPPEPQEQQDLFRYDAVLKKICDELKIGGFPDI